MSQEPFTYPFFYNYPPYFTLQPINETKEKQCGLWSTLILAYCKHHKIFTIPNSDDFPLFNNASINRRLNSEARTTFLDYLITQGNGQWLDRNKSSLLVLWRKIPEWADAIARWADTYGMRDSVVVVDDLSRGDDVRGTELEGLDRNVLMQALKVLEARGKVRLFSGATPDEEGVKFL